MQENASSSEELASTSEELASQATAMREDVKFLKTGRRVPTSSRTPSQERSLERTPARPASRKALPPRPAEAAPAKGVKITLDSKDKEDDEFERY